jgi:nicotinate-nucleotide pyrophosphorylase (carboxylating)
MNASDSPSPTSVPAQQVYQDVSAALIEDIGAGDATAALLGERAIPVTARVYANESLTLAGRPWFDAVFRVLDPRVQCRWDYADGETVPEHGVICALDGPLGSIVTGERTALNFLQTLSGTATRTRTYRAYLGDRPTLLLDTRKTLPKLRAAQKYAVRCGGGVNHRMGLDDMILLKENHLAWFDDILEAINAARRQSPGLPVVIEVETLDQLDRAARAGADRILLDNFSLEMLRAAVARVPGPMSLEASGGVTPDNLQAIAATGVSHISLGDLTKSVVAVDLSLRVDT